jgi:rod shape determining protein RodA
LLVSVFAILLITLIFNQINLNRILSVGWILFVLNIIIVLSVEFLGNEIKGSKRWIDFGFLSLQPSEFMKITFALFVIQYLRFYSFQFNTFRTLFLLAVLFLSAIPIIIQPDLGTGLVYILLGMMLLFICGMHRFYFIGMAVFGILLSPIIYSFGLTSYQKTRIISWFSSDQNLSEKWNILQSEISIGSGGLFGEGFLNSKQNEFNFLPEADTDFIFSIYAEQFGFLGILVIFILVGLFILLTTIISMEQKRLTDDLSPYFLGTYFSLVIGFSFLLNILMVSGLIPVVGLPLPFFTKGGSSLLCFSIMIGLIFSSRSFLR